MALNWIVNSANIIVFGNTRDVSKSSEAPQVGSCREFKGSTGFQMPLHYPRYKKEDYQKMEEWMVDKLLRDYGISFTGNLEEKRQFIMGAFLWSDQP